MPALAPYDRFFLASSLALIAKGLPTNPVFLRLSLTGPLDHGLLKERLARTLARHPVLTAGIACTRLTKQPFWIARRDGAPVNGEDPALPLEVVMLTNSPDPEGQRDTVLHAAAQERQNPFKGPQVRLWAFQLENERHDLVLRWPHYLMDLTGADRLLTELGAENEEPLQYATYSPPGVFASLAAWCRGMWWLKKVNFIKSTRLKASSTGDPPRFETLHRSWTEAETAAIDAAAKAACSAGPMLHTRWHITCLVRAIDAVFSRTRIHRRDHYLISLPRRREPSRRTAITGNDLTIDTLVLNRTAMSDARSIDDSITSQFADHAKRRLDDAHEMVTAFPGRFPLPLYVWLLRRFRTFPRYSIGFTSYRVDDRSSGYLGCRVDDVSFWGVPPSPPGVIASMCRFRGRLSLSLGHITHVCSPATAADIFGEMERRLVEG